MAIIRINEDHHQAGDQDGHYDQQDNDQDDHADQQDNGQDDYDDQQDNDQDDQQDYDQYDQDDYDVQEDNGQDDLATAAMLEPGLGLVHTPLLHLSFFLIKNGLCPKETEALNNDTYNDNINKIKGNKDSPFQVYGDAED